MKVVNLLEQYLATCEQNAHAFHEACSEVNISLSFAKPEFAAAGLPAKLRDLAMALLTNAIHLEPTDESGRKAMRRCLSNARPSQKGDGPKDCIIIEEYLELCRLMRTGGFAKKLVFCSSNTRDYEEGHKLDKSLESEFATVGLVYTNVLHWAVNEIKSV